MSGLRRSGGIALTVIALLVGCTSSGGASTTSVSPSTPLATALATSAPSLAATSSTPAAASSTLVAASAGPSVAPAPIGEIVFTSGRDNSKNGDQVYVMAADGSDQRLLTKDLAGGFMPNFSPDRTKIAFSSERAGDGMNVYTMNIDGSGVNEVTANKDLNSFHAQWSPDGKQIVYQGFPDELHVIGADGSSDKKVVNGAMATWLPDGAHIAFIVSHDDGKTWEIHVVAADGTGETTLSRGGLPAYSPDGKRVAFADTRDGASGIFVMSADGSSPQRLTTSPGTDDWPAWSTDGTRIAFQRAAKNDASGDIWVMSADGSNQVNLTNSPKVKDWGPSWR